MITIRDLAGGQRDQIIAVLGNNNDKRLKTDNVCRTQENCINRNNQLLSLSINLLISS